MVQLQPNRNMFLLFFWANFIETHPKCGSFWKALTPALVFFLLVLLVFFFVPSFQGSFGDLWWCVWIHGAFWLLAKRKVWFGVLEHFEIVRPQVNLKSFSESRMKDSYTYTISPFHRPAILFASGISALPCQRGCHPFGRCVLVYWWFGLSFKVVWPWGNAMLPPRYRFDGEGCDIFWNPNTKSSLEYPYVSLLKIYCFSNSRLIIHHNPPPTS